MCIRRFKLIYEKWAPTNKIFFWLAIIAIILTIILFFWSEQTSQQQHQESMNLTEKEYMLMMKECFDVIKNLTNFNNFTCQDINATKECLNQLELVNHTLLINECDSIARLFNFSENGYAVGIEFKPLWYPDGKIHYMLDIFTEYLERDRVSLFTENDVLKLRVYLSNGTEITVKTDIEGWINSQWHSIEIKWYKGTGNVFLDVDSNEIGYVIQDMQIDLQNSKLFLGSDIESRNQADGYFDNFTIRSFSYPEPTATMIGPVYTQ